MSRTALFGGTFDPIHIGHLRIANEALKAFSLDRVLFVPAGVPPHKVSLPLTPYEERFQMVEIACKPYPSFAASRLEAGSETSYTIDTLARARQDLPPGEQLFFLIGADAFAEVRTWNRWREVVRAVGFLVVSRPGTAYQVPEGATVQRLDGLELQISSSDIRRRLTSGEAVAEVPAEVREYIEQRGLYKNPA
jgi:nicotinate-nucleotide adenylyltransferase